MQSAGGTVTPDEDGALHVIGLGSEQIGTLSLREQVALIELTPQRASLEDAYLELTGGDVEYRGGTTTGAPIEERA